MGWLRREIGQQLCGAAVVASRNRRARINTIALTLENVDRGHPNEPTRSLGRMKEFMRELAQQTGGKTTAVTNAPRE